ncbi:GNAT family N-acetyltransferase [Frigoribacterium sp. PhB24]|uniref:GNAT family N-acetyltransferase n=1 Tax=Frigoribacterium sp. PhB24 TaxID=2485204 RepID=UPI000F47C4EF|nr:GNAT family N-acetyltransferase [Frigoribacterium sp. PhB24]ROS54339.1 N-acetylglutamate synthase-like GNAT family acetyltransferase [Frigoribacterium sp. PhB24]
MVPRTWTVRPACPDNLGPLTELKLAVLRPEFERLGIWNPPRHRARFEREFVATETRVVEDDRRLLGCIALHPGDDTTWLRHFYLVEEARGHGIGTTLLAEAIASVAAGSITLDVLTGSRAVSLYERTGFVVVDQDDVDTVMRRGRSAPRRGSQARTAAASTIGSTSSGA